MKFIIFVLLKVFCKITSHIKYPMKLRIKFNDLIHKVVFSYLKPYFRMSKNIINEKKHVHMNNSGIIWVFWWQGFNKMPLIVKCCIHSIVIHSNGHKVILISEHNVHEYAEIPRYIYDKLKDGDITFTHFSDILRFNLLKIYGGLWIDSTVYCVRNLDSTYFGEFYTSGPGGFGTNKNHDFISNKWTGFLIGGCKYNPIFDFMDTFFKLYWDNNNRLIDYFLIDYGLYYIYLNNIGGFYRYVNNVAYNHNPRLHDLMTYLNNKFNLNCFYNLIKDTDMFKLTYKMKLHNNGDTFYRRIINNRLD